MKPSPLRHPSEKLSTGCTALDKFLDGGIPIGHVTELVSESGCGKTQLCLQLSLSSPSLYLHSDFPFPLRRLSRLSLSSQPSSTNPLDTVFVKPVYSADQLLDVLLQLDPILKHSQKDFPFKVIIVDSIAALFRSEFDNTGSDLKKRASLFFKISGKLRGLASKFGLAVVVTNQVVDVMGSGEEGNVLKIGKFGRLFSSGREVSPALGLSWANCVNSRIFLSRDEVTIREEGVSANGNELVKIVTRRQLFVVFSPYLPESSCEYVISRDGVFGVDNKAIVLKDTL